MDPAYSFFDLGATTSNFDSSFPLSNLLDFASNSDNNNNVFNGNAAAFSPIKNPIDLVNTLNIMQQPLDMCPPQPTLLNKSCGSNEKTVKILDGGYEQMLDQDEVVHAIGHDKTMNSNGCGQGGKVTSSSAGGGGEGSKGGNNKKKFPAKSLIPERKRRAKLKDRVLKLRSLVPKITKLTHGATLTDATDYIKELRQKVSDLQNELESTPSSSQLPTPTGSSFHPLTPTIPTLPSLLSPTGQPKVEVRIREGNAVNIHMFCSQRPGLLHSALRALDVLGIDIQQALISCCNGFTLDVFRAEQFIASPATRPEDIKAVLLQSAGYQGAI